MGATESAIDAHAKTSQRSNTGQSSTGHSTPNPKPRPTQTPVTVSGTGLTQPVGDRTPAMNPQTAAAPATTGLQPVQHPAAQPVSNRPASNRPDPVLWESARSGSKPNPPNAPNAPVPTSGPTSGPTRGATGTKQRPSQGGAPASQRRDHHPGTGPRRLRIPQSGTVETTPRRRDHHPGTGPAQPIAKPARPDSTRSSRSAEDQAELQRNAAAFATTNDYKDYLTLARTALEDGGAQAAEELREIARLHRAAVATDRPNDADRFEQELGQVLDAVRGEENAKTPASTTPDEVEQDTAQDLIEESEAAFVEALESARSEADKPASEQTVPQTEIERTALLYVRSNGNLTPGEAYALLDQFQADAEELGEQEAWDNIQEQAERLGQETSESIWLVGRNTNRSGLQPGQNTGQLARMAVARETMREIREIVPGWRYEIIRPNRSESFTNREVRELTRLRDTLQEVSRLQDVIRSLSPNHSLPPISTNAVTARRQIEDLNAIIRNSPSFENHNSSVINPHYHPPLTRPGTTSPTLNRIYEQLWRQSDVFPGGTVAMLRREARRGQTEENHLEKAIERSKQLLRLLSNPNIVLSRTDRQGAWNVYRELQSAIDYARVMGL